MSLNGIGRILLEERPTVRYVAGGLPFATDQDLSALAAIRSTERGVMQVGLMRAR